MLIVIVLILYLYGSMAISYVSGAESLMEAISFTIYGDECYLSNTWSLDPYYVGVMVFGGLSLIFSFGDIENSKWI